MDGDYLYWVIPNQAASGDPIGPLLNEETAVETAMRLGGVVYGVAVMYVAAPGTGQRGPTETEVQR